MKTLLLLASFLLVGCAVESSDAGCTAATASATSCDGAVLVAACGTSVARVACDSSACPSGTRALGCRIGQDDRAFCECGCTEAADTCASSNTLRYCFGGELVDMMCSDEVCREAGLGRTLGCSAEGGKPSCICESK